MKKRQSSQGCGPQCCELCQKKPQLTDFLYELRVVVRVCESVFVSLFGSGVVLRCGAGDVCVVVWKKWAALPCGGSAAVVYF